MKYTAIHHHHFPNE